QYGRPRDTRRKESIIHCFDVHAVFPVPATDDSEVWFDISRADAERYLTDVLRPTPPTAMGADGKEVSTVDYHYGERIQNWLGHNQLAEVIQRLKENPETKRASISILQAPDLETLEDAPCWSLITFAVIDRTLHSSHTFRSHDMYGGWPNNVLAILRLHRRVAEELGVALGSVEVISQNAQIYSRHLEAATQWLDQRGFTLARASHAIGFRSDPAGSFAFTILEDKRVRAQLLNPAGDEVLWETEHANPSVLIRWIVESMVLEPQHVRYLGAEEEKLNRSLKTGEPYHQG
ncbi:MAG: thymidylate synthase, partial [Patescibacteria group bacterium]